MSPKATPVQVQLIRRDWRVLQHLRGVKSATLKDIARAYGWREVTLAGLAARRLHALGLATYRKDDGDRAKHWSATYTGLTCEVQVVFQTLTPELLAARTARIEQARQLQLARREAAKRRDPLEDDDDDGVDLMPVRQVVVSAHEALPVPTRAPNSVWQLARALEAA